MNSDTGQTASTEGSIEADRNSHDDAFDTGNESHTQAKRAWRVR